jgi:hypothetical protein
MSEMFVESALGLPLLTPGTSLLFHTFNDAMKVLIATVFFHSPFVFPVTFPRIFTLTRPAPSPQPAPIGAILAKLTFVFLLFASAAPFHLRLPVYVLLLIPDSQIGQ